MARGAVERHDRLGLEPEALVEQRRANRADQGEVGIAAHDALVAVGIDLDPVAAPVLGRLARDLGRGERVRQRMVAAHDRRDAEARGDVDGLAVANEPELLQRVAQAFGEVLRMVDRRVRQHQREAVARNARGQHARRHAAPDRLGHAHDDLVAHVHA